MTEQIARFKPGANVPGFAVTAVVAGHFVKIVADKTSQGDYSIGHCGAGEQALGVAERDSAAATEPAHSVERRVNVVRRGAIARVLAGADITAGAAVKSDGTGLAIPQAGTGIILGYACNTADFDTGQYVEVDLI
jgi:hypothetical protein